VGSLLSGYNPIRRSNKREPTLGRQTSSIGPRNSKVTELHHNKLTLEIERDITVDLTNGRARARDVITAINREGEQRPALAKASQNVVMGVTPLDTLLAPSADATGKVYCQMKDILGTTAVQQVESSLKCQAKVSVSSLGHSKVNRHKAATEPLVVGTTSSPAQILVCARLSHPNGHSKHPAHR
jgi:hypothetical protein